VLAEATISAGSAEGVVTFARPITWEELAQIEALGVVVQRVEIVTAPDREGLRWTFSAPNEFPSRQQVQADATQGNVTVLGITSAEVIVPDAEALQGLQDSPLVYLADLSIADFRLHNFGLTDVSQNDLYWQLAGWE
jgi:hypothetical protein